MLLLLKIPSTIKRQTALARASAKKPRSSRAQFYSALMRALGGKTGDELGTAFTSGDKEKFLNLMGKLSGAMADVEKQVSKSSEAPATFEVIVRAVKDAKSVVHQPVLLAEAVRSMRLLNSLGLSPTARTYIGGEEKILSFDDVAAMSDPDSKMQTVTKTVPKVDGAQ